METASLVQRVQDRRSLPPPAMRRAIREAAHLSLGEVGEEVGVTAQAVSKWELGERFPRREHLHRYAELLRLLLRES